GEAQVKRSRCCGRGAWGGCLRRGGLLHRLGDGLLRERLGDVDRGLLDGADGLRGQAIAHPQGGWGVTPICGVAPEPLAKLANEDVDGPVAVGHRVAPDLLVDLLALDHLTVGLGEELEQLELASGETDALAADESLVLVGPDLELAGDEGTDVLTRR